MLIFNHLAKTHSVRCKKAAQSIPNSMFSMVYLRHWRAAQCGAPGALWQVKPETLAIL